MGMGRRAVGGAALLLLLLLSARVCMGAACRAGAGSRWCWL